MPDESNPTTTPQEQTPQQPEQPPAQPEATPEQPETGEGKGGKDALKADLARERDKRQELERTVTEMQNAQKQQSEALAKALGVQPDEGGKPDDLAAQIAALQEQFTASQRRTQILELSAEHEIPKDYQHLLTATEPEALAAQAKSVGELVKVKNEAAGTPPFQPNPGQGQGAGTPASIAEQIAAAESEGDRNKVMALKTQQLAELHNKNK